MNHFDSRLNELLGEANRVEPLHGFEERIHARLRQRQALRRVALFGAPIAACAVLAVVVAGRMHMTPATTQVPLVALKRAPAVQQPMKQESVQAQTQVAVNHPRTRAVAVVKQEQKEEEPLPKLATFPAPAEDTPEHRALLALARQPDEAALRAARDLNLQQQRPIEIAEIRIEPLRQEKSQ